MKNQKGFIQISMLIAIIAGVLILGGTGYIGIKKYQNYRAEKIAQEKEKQSQALAEAQQKALEEAQSEIENLKKQTEDQKKQQNIIEQKLAQDKTEESTEITSADLKPYITGVVKVSCDNSSGSGTLWKLGTNQYSVVTNFHVVKNLSVNNSCDVSTENLEGYANDGGVYSIGPNISSWNNIADEAILDLRVWDKPNNLENYGIKMSSIEDLNYKISSLPKCPTSMPVGSPVAILGYPAFSEKQTVVNGVSMGTTLTRIVSNGIISGYDTTSRFSGLPYQNYFISAKIDSGNSGGIAFSKNKNGLCNLGIPTWLTLGNYETQGLVQNIHNILYKQ